MRLNPECIRDILLTVEEKSSLTTQMRYSAETTHELLMKYSVEEVGYHIKQAELTGFFTKVSWFVGNGIACIVYDLSPAGHEFLANIRSDSVWNKTKEAAQKVGSFSLDSLTKIAVNVVSSLIKDIM